MRRNAGFLAICMDAVMLVPRQALGARPVPSMDDGIAAVNPTKALGRISMQPFVYVDGPATVGESLVEMFCICARTNPEQIPELF
jgi:hypothetical protein